MNAELQRIEDPIRKIVKSEFLTLSKSFLPNLKSQIDLEEKIILLENKIKSIVKSVASLSNLFCKVEKSISSQAQTQSTEMSIFKETLDSQIKDIRDLNSHSMDENNNRISSKIDSMSKSIEILSQDLSKVKERIKIIETGKFNETEIMADLIQKLEERELDHSMGDCIKKESFEIFKNSLNSHISELIGSIEILKKKGDSSGNAEIENRLMRISKVG